MRVFVESVLPCDADRAWAAVQTTALFMEVIRPLAAVVPLTGAVLPQRWLALTTVRCRLYLFGLIPLGIRSLRFDRIDQEAREIHTRESDPVFRRWDHIIRVKPIGLRQCRYSDEIEIDAGPLTALLAGLVRRFYQHRQRRWQTVARRLQAGRGCRTRVDRRG